MTHDSLRAAADAALEGAVSRRPGVPGVAAAVTDRRGVIYRGAAGERVLGGGAEMTTDTVCAVFSTTKAVAGAAVLQLAEEGRLDLDAPAKNYTPAIGGLQVLEGFDGGGGPVLRPPERDITTRMLLLHTAGFGYDLFNEHYNRLAREHGKPRVASASMESLTTPLLFDPGSEWEYGAGIDWAGLVVEGITGERLGEVMAERIFEPLGMDSTSFNLEGDMRSRLADVHQRRSDGSLAPLGFELPPDPEVHMAGHGLYSTAEDYAKFIRMWLNDGMGPGGRILQKETVEAASQNGLEGGMKVKALPGVIPRLTHDAEFFPGMPKTWGLTFMINEEDAPTGRPAGSLAWAGLANLYYWIDRRNGVGGFWAAQVFPFLDPASLNGYLNFETAVYEHAV